jgi:hypothetical protein
MNITTGVLDSVLQNIEVICVVLAGIVLILVSRVNSKINHKMLRRELLLHLGIAAVVAAAIMFFIDRRLADRLLTDVHSHLDRNALNAAVGGDDRLLREVERQIFRRPIRYYGYLINAEIRRVSDEDPHTEFRAATTVFVKNISTLPLEWTFNPSVASNRIKPARARLTQKPTIKLCSDNTRTPGDEDLIKDSAWTEYLDQNNVTPEDVERGFRERIHFSATVKLQPDKLYQVAWTDSFDEDLASETFHFTRETADSMTLNFTYNPSEFDIEPEVIYPSYSEMDKTLVRLPSNASLDSVRGRNEPQLVTIVIDSSLFPFQGIHVQWKPIVTQPS